MTGLAEENAKDSPDRVQVPVPRADRVRGKALTSEAEGETGACAEVVCQYAICGSYGCDYAELVSLEVQQVTADSRGRWAAVGRGQSETGYCPSCGLLCQLITERLPVELDGLPCPSCRRTGDYELALECVQVRANEFEFRASVTCPGCAGQSVFRKLIKALRRVRRIKVGVTGLELDLESGDVSQP